MTLVSAYNYDTSAIERLSRYISSLTIPQIVKRGSLSHGQKLVHGIATQTEKMTLDSLAVLLADSSISLDDVSAYMYEDLKSAIMLSRRAAEGVSRECVLGSLKRHGHILVPALPEMIGARIDDTFTSVLDRLGSGDRQDNELVVTAYNIVSGMSGNVVNHSFRSTLRQTAIKIRETTGVSVKAHRIVHGRRPCAHCLEMAAKWYPLETEDFSGFHDYCQCVIDTEWTA